MELHGEGGAIIFLEPGCKKELGRGPGIRSRDLTVSRRQVLLELPKDNDENLGDDRNGVTKVYVQVIGPNPICILRSDDSKEKPIVEFLKKGEQGYIRIGDRLSLSVKEPHFFTLKKGCPEKPINGEEDEIEEAVARRQRRAMERKKREKTQTEDVLRGGHTGELGQGPQPKLDLELDQHEAQIQDLDLDTLDLSQIDPVAEFGFLVEGSEFEQYGKRRVNNPIKWDWCLSKDSEKSSEDEDITEEWELNRIKRKGKKKKKEKREDEDEEWTGESEEEKMQVTKLRGSKKPNYLKTRSKIQRADATNNVSANTGPKEKQLDNKLKDDDETLGSFIADDDEDETMDDDEEEDEWTDDDVEEQDEDEDKIEHGVQKRENRKKRKPLCKYGSNCYRKNKEHLAEFRHS